MLLLSLTKYGLGSGRYGGLAAILAMLIGYFLTVYLYMGIATLMYYQNHALLWSALPVAIVVGILISGPGQMAITAVEWSMLTAGGVMTGKLLRRSGNIRLAYMSGAFVVGLAALIWLNLQWELLHEAVRLAGNSLIELAQSAALGQGESLSDERSNEIARMIEMIIRLLPAIVAVTHLVQYTLGGMGFFVSIARCDKSAPRPAPFSQWSMPFWVMTIIPLSLFLRFAAGDMVAMVVDNILLVLTLFYSVVGMSLMQFFLRQLRLSGAWRVVFYLLLIPTGVVGYLLIALAGLMDSFFDWRKLKRPQESLDN